MLAAHHQQEVANLELQRVQGDLLLAQTSVTSFITKLGSLDAVRSLRLHLKRLQTKQPQLCDRAHKEYRFITDCGTLLL